MDKKSPAGWSESHSKVLRTAASRRSPRMNCRVPVSIEWNCSKAGAQRLETAFTRVVNSHGCLLVSPKELDIQQRLRVTNLVTSQGADAEVVWKGTERPDGWDLGVRLTEPQMDFWGLEI